MLYAQRRIFLNEKDDPTSTVQSKMDWSSTSLNNLCGNSCGFASFSSHAFFRLYEIILSAKEGLRVGKVHTAAEPVDGDSYLHQQRRASVPWPPPKRTPRCSHHC